MTRTVSHLANLSLTTPPPPSQPPLLDLTPRSTVYDDGSRDTISSRAATADHLGRLVPKVLQQHRHRPRSNDTPTENPNHSQITSAEPMRAFDRISRPPRVQRVRRGDTTQIPEARDKGRRGCYPDLSMARLEDLRGPRHGDRHSGTKTSANKEEAYVACPGTGLRGEGGGEQTSDLHQDGSGEEVGAETVEAV